MRIRTQFILTILLFGILMAVIIASIIFTNQQVEKASRQENIANSIAQGASDLSYLANDYLITVKASNSAGGSPGLLHFRTKWTA